MSQIMGGVKGGTRVPIKKLVPYRRRYGEIHGDGRRLDLG